jgi:hypothetical protein
VARAKRTDRAEARRRYRASLVDEALSEDEDAEEDTELEAVDPSEERRPSGRERVRAASTAQTPPARPSIVRAFSSSFTPLDLRGDIAALPRLLLHRSFFIPLGLIVAAAVALTLTGGTEPITFTLSQYLLFPPPVAAVFLAGFLAPRASWLIGAVLGAAATVALVAVLFSPTVQAMAASATAGGEGAFSPLVILSYSSIGGALFAAVAAWYKRFLFLANPARAARANARQNERQRKRGSENRPALARRR